MQDILARRRNSKDRADFEEGKKRKCMEFASSVASILLSIPALSNVVSEVNIYSKNTGE